MKENTPMFVQLVSHKFVPSSKKRNLFNTLSKKKKTNYYNNLGFNHKPNFFCSPKSILVAKETQLFNHQGI